MLKALQAVTHGLEVTYSNYGLGGMASAFQLQEISHTHYWSKDFNESSVMDQLTTQSSSPRSPQSPRSSIQLDWDSRKSSHSEAPEVRLQSGAEDDPEGHHSTAEMFKDMLNQKKNMLLSKLTSFESDVSRDFG